MPERLQEWRPLLDGTLEIAGVPTDEIHLSLQLVEDPPGLILERLPIRLPKDEDVDIAGRIVIAAGIRAEDERHIDPSLASECFPDPGRDADRTRVELAQ